MVTASNKIEAKLRSLHGIKKMCGAMAKNYIYSNGWSLVVGIILENILHLCFGIIRKCTAQKTHTHR